MLPDFCVNEPEEFLALCDTDKPCLLQGSLRVRERAHTKAGQDAERKVERADVNLRDRFHQCVFGNLEVR